MATYLYIPDIAGNVTTGSYQHWIQIDSFHVYTRRDIYTYPGSTDGREVSGPSLSELVVTKLADNASPLLMQDSLSDTVFDSIKLHVCRTGTKGAEVYQGWEFKNVIISHYAVHQGQAQKPSERISLNYTAMEQTFTPSDSSHISQSPITSGYNLMTGQTA